MIRVSQRRSCKPWPSLVFLMATKRRGVVRVRGKRVPLSPFLIHGLPRWRTPRWHHLMIRGALPDA